MPSFALTVPRIARNTIARWIENVRNNTVQTVGKAQCFSRYSLALDESTDVCNTSQLLVFFRGVDVELNVTQELASLHSMHGTTIGDDIFKEIQKTLTEFNLDWNSLQCVDS
jgi:hypothetical protein